jgi:ABC-type oligopeptide transport system ATPase subunit
LLKLLNVDWQVIHHILAKKFPSSGKRIRSQKPEYENHGRKHYFVLKMDKIVISMVQDTEDTGVIAQSIEFMERLQKKLNLTVLFENLGQ